MDISGWFNFRGIFRGMLFGHRSHEKAFGLCRQQTTGQSLCQQ